jgi:hypothetical protein
LNGVPVRWHEQGDEQPFRLAGEMPEERDEARRRLGRPGCIGRLQEPLEEGKHGAQNSKMAARAATPSTAVQHDPTNLSERAVPLVGVRDRMMAGGAETANPK